MNAKMFIFVIMGKKTIVSALCRRSLFIAVCVTFFSLEQSVHAQEDSAAGTVSAPQSFEKAFEVRFRVNRSAIEPGFSDNARRLSELLGYIDRLQKDTLCEITHIHFWGTSSPEGSFQCNRRLAGQRAAALEEFVRGRMPVPADRVSRSGDYLAWEDIRAWAGTSGMTEQQAIEEIIGSEAGMEAYGKDGSTIDRRVLRLQQLDGGRVWTRLRTYFPEMRRAGVSICSVVRAADPEPSGIAEAEASEASVPYEAAEAVSVGAEEPVLLCVPEEEASAPCCTETEAEPAVSPANPGRGGRVLVKTDIAGWALSMLNIAGEIDLCPHWSFSLPVYYSCADFFSQDLKFRIFGIRPELRWWVSSANEGFFVNVHGGMAYYNFAFKGDYRYQAHDGDTPAWGGGLGLGYRLPLGSRWRLEFVAGGGAYSVHYDRFFNTPGGALADSRRQLWVGPDQLTIAVGYSFGPKKGGTR